MKTLRPEVIANQFLGEAIAIAEARSQKLGYAAEEYRRFMDEAGRQIFLDWLQQERFDELIAYIHYTFGQGGGLEFCFVLRWELEQRRDISRLHRLFRGLIPGRIACYRIELKYAKQELVGNMTNAVECKGEALRVLYEYFNCMSVLGETAVVDTLRQQIKDLYFDQPKKVPKAVETELTQTVFWELITEARNSGNLNGFIPALEAKLVTFKAAEIKKFHQHLSEAMANLWSWDLWALAYIAQGGCSDDAFDYFRAWIVSQGQAAYAAALQGPEALVDTVELTGNLECEALMYVAPNAYYERQGKEMPVGRSPKIVAKGNPWQEDELEQRYPTLWQRFQPVDR